MKSWLKRTLPRLFLALRRLRYLVVPERLDPITQGLVEALTGGDLRVLAGPFAGMRYLERASGGGLLPKLAGSYELELHPAVAESLGRAYRTVVNVGAAEGYYAVGYALRLPEAEVWAFDTDVVARERLRALARLNGVEERVRVRGTCSAEELRRLAGPGTLVVCDCEGCEVGLLDPEVVAELGHCDLLVELHDFMIPGAAERVTERFAGTHHVEVTVPRARGELELQHLAHLEPSVRRRVVDEGRPAGIRWAWMRRRDELGG